MLRSFLTLLWAVAALAATAQTTPRPAHKTAMRKPARPPKATTPVPAAATAASSAATDGGFGNGAPGSSANADGKGQGVYAAPGMAVDVTPGKEVGSYKGTTDKATPAKAAPSGTTLSPK